MRIAFAGTPEFAARALAALIAASPRLGAEIALVLTQPDRRAGRGMKPAASAVKSLALLNGLLVATPATLSPDKGGAETAVALEHLHEARVDVLVVAAYGLILPPAVLALPRGLPDAGFGRVTAVNIHASLLPRWRGAAPVARAIEAGDRATGITIMQMDAGLDTGPMLFTHELPIPDDATTTTLTQRLSTLGARAIVESLEAGGHGHWRAIRQDEAAATYARKLERSEAQLDWTQGAELLARRVRAFDPFPVAASTLRQATVRVWRAFPLAEPAGKAPGTVLRADAQGVVVATGSGCLVITELQRASGKRLAAREFLAGLPIAPGERFAAAAATVA